MNIALGQAMTRNPRLLLSYYDRFPKALPQWCVPGLMEPTDAQWRSALDKAQHAIEAVKDERLRPARDICLGQILLYKSRLGR
jgi:hypothetical protein